MGGACGGEAKRSIEGESIPEVEVWWLQGGKVLTIIGGAWTRSPRGFKISRRKTSLRMAFQNQNYGSHLKAQAIIDVAQDICASKANGHGATLSLPG